LLNREVGPKEPGSYRILFLGDSLIAMGDTSSGELFTQVLERGLDARSADPPNSVEVINAGVPGYTTYQELEFLKIHGLDMRPDMVNFSGSGCADAPRFHSMRTVMCTWPGKNMDGPMFDAS